MQEAAGGGIRMVTIAPERPGAIPFIAKLAASGVVVAIGHTAATVEQIRAAVDAGARTSTHLGNGAHAILPRHPNYIWEQLAEDRLWCSVISDGHHLSAAVLKCIVRAKGVAKTLITCDASSLAGRRRGSTVHGEPIWRCCRTGKSCLRVRHTSPGAATSRIAAWAR